MSNVLKLTWAIQSINQTSQQVLRSLDGNSEVKIADLDATATTYDDETGFDLAESSLTYRVASVGVYRGESTYEFTDPVTFTKSTPFKLNITGDSFMMNSGTPFTTVVGAGETITATPKGVSPEIYTATYTFPEAGDRTVEIRPVAAEPLLDVEFIGATSITEVVSWPEAGFAASLPLAKPIAGLTAAITAVPATAPKTTSFRGLFEGAVLFNQDISGWVTTGVTNFADTFKGAVLFNQDISGWDTSAATTMNGIFDGASAFNQPIGTWDVSSVQDFANAFRNAAAFNQDISGWDVSAATNMFQMFDGATVFSQNLAVWCVSGVTSEPAGFDAMSALTANQLPVWGTCPVETYTLTIDQVSELMANRSETLKFNLSVETDMPIIAWTSRNVEIATVDNTGLLTGVAPGEAVIDLLINNYYAASTTVTIVPEQIIVGPSNLTVSLFSEL